MNKMLRVRCPHCDTEFAYYDSDFRPFCTEKCKMIDLGHWFKESYAVPLKETVTENDNEEEIESDHEEFNED